MEKSLGQTIVSINQPGASGPIGTRSALEATKDGYTWTAGAAQDLGASTIEVPVHLRSPGVMVPVQCVGRTAASAAAALSGRAFS